MRFKTKIHIIQKVYNIYTIVRTNASGYNDIIQAYIYMYHYTCFNIMIGPTVNCRRRVFQLTNRICGNYNPAVGVRDRDREKAIYVTIAKV